MQMFTKKPHPCGVRSLSFGEILATIWVFPVKDFFLFGGQIIGIIPEQIVYLAFIESEQMLTDIIAIVNPKDDIRFAVLAETHAPGHDFMRLIGVGKSAFKPIIQNECRQPYTWRVVLIRFPVIVGNINMPCHPIPVIPAMGESVFNGVFLCGGHGQFDSVSSTQTAFEISV
jgi:hypothetical protein